jgi:hypothetical protein
MKEITEEEILEDEKKHEPESHIPEIAKKVSKFGNHGGMSKFRKGAMSFTPPNKQRPGRAA